MIVYEREQVSNCGAFVASVDDDLMIGDDGPSVLDRLYDIYHDRDNRALGLVLGTEEELDLLEIHMAKANDRLTYERMSKCALYVFSNDYLDDEGW